MSPRQTCAALTLLLLCPMMTSCAGVKSATPLSIPDLRSNPIAADVGYTNGVGVPSLAERMAARPGLKVGIVQVCYGIQGRPQMTFTTDIWQFGNVTTWKETTTPEVMVPGSLAVSASLHATKAIEKALAAAGFDVIPHDRIANTAAYKKYYDEYPVGYAIKDGMLGGLTIVGAPPMRVYEVPSIFAWGNLHQVWPDTQALKDIRAELGEDTLLMCLKVESKTLQGRRGNLIVSSMLNVADPEYVGYGIGGYGHLVTALDATTDRNGANVDNFLDAAGDQWRVNWTPVFQDLTRVHDAFAAGFANELKNMAWPSAAAQ